MTQRSVSNKTPDVTTQGSEQLYQWLVNARLFDTPMGLYYGNEIIVNSLSMPHPNLKSRWQAQPQHSELFGFSAPHEGEMINFAIAETWQAGKSPQVEQTSAYVLPVYQSQPIENRSHQHFQQAVHHPAPHFQHQ